MALFAQELARIRETLSSEAVEYLPQYTGQTYLILDTL